MGGRCNSGSAVVTLSRYVFSCKVVGNRKMGERLIEAGLRGAEIHPLSGKQKMKQNKDNQINWGLNPDNKIS